MSEPPTFENLIFIVGFCRTKTLCPGKWQWRRKVATDKEVDPHTPYTHHQEYIDDLHDVILKYPNDMARKNSRGQTLRQTLINGASFSHFAYLQNGGRAIQSMAAQDRLLWAMGTTANEALHSEFNSTQRTVVQQHLESIESVLFSFSFAKLLAHHAAAYCPTVSQRSQSQLLALMLGQMQRHFCKQFSFHNIRPARTRTQVRRPVHHVLPANVQAFQRTVAEQKLRWARHVLRKPRHLCKKPVKRTVFTKRKQPKPRAEK